MIGAQETLKEAYGLSNEYNLLMEYVNPSPDLEQRLHDALDKPPVRKPPAWRRYGAAAACLVLIIGAQLLCR